MEADSTIRGLLRHFGTIIGAYLVHKGWIDGGDVEAVIGALIALGSIGWSVWNKRQTTKTITAALDLPSGASREDLKVAVASSDETPKA